MSPGLGAIHFNPVDSALSALRIQPLVEATVKAVGVEADVAETITPLADQVDLSTKLDVSGATTCQALPV
jgi:hypothetical protein